MRFVLVVGCWLRVYRCVDNCGWFDYVDLMCRLHLLCLVYLRIWLGVWYCVGAVGFVDCGLFDLLWLIAGFVWLFMLLWIWFGLLMGLLVIAGCCLCCGLNFGWFGLRGVGVPDCG